MPEDLSPVQWFGRQAVVSLPEHVDVSNAGQIREALLAILNRGAQALIVDMTATVSCDQAGADAVVRAHQRAFTSGAELRLVVASEIVRRVLSITGVDRLVPMYPTLQASLAARAPSASGQLTLVGEPARARTGGRRESRAVRAAEAARGQRPGPAQPDPDVGVEVALLDRVGVIVSVNQAWEAFAQANGGDRARVGRGVSYLDVCAAAGDDPVATQVAAAIRSALAGDLPGPLAVEVPCHSPRTARWYHMLISARQDDIGRCLGVTVTMSLARSRPLAGQEGQQDQQDQEAAAPVRRAAPMLPDLAGRLFDALPDAVALADGNGTLVLVNRRLEKMFGYRHAELLGQSFESLIPADLQNARRPAPRRATGVRTRESGRRGAGGQLVALRRDGSTFPAEISISPVTTASSRFALTVIRESARRVESLDRVITSLYEVGLSLQQAIDLPAELPAELSAERIAEALEHLDEAISQIRQVAFTVRYPGAVP